MGLKDYRSYRSVLGKVPKPGWYLARASARAILPFALLAVILIANLYWRAPSASAADFTIYDNSLAENWRHRSWDSVINFSAAPGYDSGRAISWQVTKPGARLLLYTD